MTRNEQQLDRAVGAVLASAAGDALGSQYEFGPVLPDDRPLDFGIGHFGHARGEWTDDTSMAVPILRALAAGESLTDPETLGGVVAAWLAWSLTARDVGVQTSAVLRGLRGEPTEEEAVRAARAVHERTGRSAGNGSLMRTGPVALGHLADGAEPGLVEAATRIAALTHTEPDNADACVLWCLAIRHAIRTGELAMTDQLGWLPAERRDRWAGLIDEATAPGVRPHDFAAQNGWVVAAFQAALSAITHTGSLVSALEEAVRGGRDTDTVAAITGSLAGALHGASALPQEWLPLLHGWPGLRADDLADLAKQAVWLT